MHWLTFSLRHLMSCHSWRVGIQPSSWAHPGGYSCQAGNYLAQVARLSLSSVTLLPFSTPRKRFRPLFAYNDDSHSYWLDGKRAPNVTTIIRGGVPIPTLVDWSARMTAEWVMDHADEMPALYAGGREPGVAFLSKIHDEVRNRAGVKGTQVHTLAEAVIHDEPTEVPQELAGYVAGYVRFLNDFGPEPILTERPVANRALRYAGRPDLIAELGGQVWLLDNKTSTYVYGDTALQCAAYARAEVYLDELGNEKPLPHIERIGVVHIGPMGTELYDLGDIDTAFTEFAAARATYEGTKRRRRLIGEPMRVEDILDPWVVRA